MFVALFSDGEGGENKWQPFFIHILCELVLIDRKLEHRQGSAKLGEEMRSVKTFLFVPSSFFFKMKVNQNENK